MARTPQVDALPGMTPLGFKQLPLWRVVDMDGRTIIKVRAKDYFQARHIAAARHMTPRDIVLVDE